MRLPTYDEIRSDPGQLDVLETGLGESLFVVGPPGSGKTVLAVRRAQMLARDGTSVTLITYNRMLRRLVAQLTTGQVPAKTMHAFVWDRYRGQVNAEPPRKDEREYDYDWRAMFDRLQDRGVAPERTHVVVDEGQDLPKWFFRYLRDFTATALTVFADEDQAVTEERSSLRDIEAAGRFDRPVPLRTNHRNTPEIARLAEHFHAGDAPVPAVQGRPSGELPRLICCRAERATELIANWYRTRGGHVGVAVVHNDTGETLYSRLRDKLAGQRVQIYTNVRQNEDEIELLEPGITILNVLSIKGQEFDAVFLMEFADLLLGDTAENKRKMYMLCARARDNLFLMYDGDRLPDALLDRLPGPDVLDRP